MKNVIKQGEVWTIKLTSGEEVITRVEEIHDDYISVKSPLSVAPGQNGMGLMASIFTADDTSNTYLSLKTITMAVLTAEPVKAQYLKTVTGLVVPEKKIILG